MRASRRSALPAALIFALAFPCWADGVSISMGAGGGLAFGFGGELLTEKSMDNQQLPMGGLQFSGNYGWAAGPGTLELGAATGFSTSGNATYMPLVLTLGYSVPMADNLAVTAGIRGGPALIVRNEASFHFEPVIGPWLELVTRGRGQPWGFYLGLGADFVLEEYSVGALFTAGLGFRSFLE